MDVSQLCSNNPEEPSNEDSSKFENSTQRNPTSLQFILSPNEEAQKNKTNNDSKCEFASMEQVLVHCSKLCENVWQLKLQNKKLTETERDEMIERLSDSAKSVFRGIQSTKELVSRDNMKKRDSSKLANTFDSNNEELRDEDEEDEDLDEEGDYLKETSTNNTFNDYAEYELIRQARNIQNNQTKSKYRRRNRRNMIGQKCHSCGTTETPEWRRGPDGARTLCNACGLHYSKLLKKGSIAVQTQNYLLTGGSPELSRSNDTISKLLQNNSNNVSFKSIETPSKSITNFPFVMMDPKYGLIDKQSEYTLLPSTNHSSPVPRPIDTHTPQLSPIDSRTNDNFVNSNNKYNINNDQINSTASFSSNSSNSQNNLTPLRIHQWKKNH